MEIIETIDSVVNHRTGETSTLRKLKPKAPMMGKVSIELFDEHGNLEQEATLNNIAMNWITEMCYKSYYDNYVAWRYSTASNGTQGDISHQNMWPLRRLYLTDWTGTENPNTPMVCGRTIGWAETGYLYSGNSTTQGSFNNSEHKWRINEQGQRVFTLVYDFPTHAANGTFQSVWLAPLTNEGYDTRNLSYARTGSEVHWWSYNTDTLPADLKSHMNTYIVSKIGYGNSSCVTIQDGELITVKPQYAYYSNNSPYKNDPWKNNMVIMIWEAKTGKYKEHRIVSNFNGANYANIGTGYTNEYHAVSTCKLPNNNIACVAWTNQNTILIHWIDPDGNSVDNVTLNNTTFQGQNGAKLTLTPYDLFTNFYYSNYAKLDTKTQTLYLIGHEYISDTQRYSYLIKYDLKTKTYTLKLLNPLLNPYISASYRDNSYYFICANESTDATICVYLAYRDTSNSWTYSRVGLFDNECTVRYTAHGYSCSSKWTNSPQSGDMKAFIHQSSGYYILDPGNVRPTTHTLLPAPITKTQSHTMKVTYQVITDMLAPESCDDFFRQFVSQNTGQTLASSDSVFVEPEQVEFIDLNPHLTAQEPVSCQEPVTTLELQGGNE